MWDTSEYSRRKLTTLWRGGAGREFNMPEVESLLKEYAEIEKRRARRWWLVAPVFLLLIVARPLMEEASFGRGPAADAPILVFLVFVGLAIMAYVFIKNFQDSKKLKALATKINAASGPTAN